jgi:hypothetical protein
VAASSFCEGDTVCVPGDHQIFVGRDRAHDATRLGRTDCTGVSIIACRIEFYPEKAQSRASAPSYLGGPLADSPGEYQNVEAAQSGRQRSNLFPRLVAEHFNVLSRARIGCRDLLQPFHVTGRS